MLYFLIDNSKRLFVTVFCNVEFDETLKALSGLVKDAIGRPTYITIIYIIRNELRMAEESRTDQE